ncbi:hypothetical protein LS684_14430 [Cytobacillus spongiae]|jgi:hypothetical protein|uniref:hypothetical protein n=1 Tax=Cytobacillus spongiae TaxID=2901381 RepID=UPI001F258A36|nr:hypothetical protein [Cytobacillus spongiae]UII54847.1 hypothetical protein LS684_14430 [Cytobacillus spongiae]
MKEQTGTLLLYEQEDERSIAVDLLKEGDMYENVHTLFQTSPGHPGESFTDYGFVSKGDVYLYIELLEAFTIIKGETDGSSMAIYQMEEHVVYTTIEGAIAIYFIDRHLKELIPRIASAYDIEVSFLDLDKMPKKI